MATNVNGEKIPFLCPFVCTKYILFQPFDKSYNKKSFLNVSLILVSFSFFLSPLNVRVCFNAHPGLNYCFFYGISTRELKTVVKYKLDFKQNLVYFWGDSNIYVENYFTKLVRTCRIIESHRTIIE